MRKKVHRVLEFDRSPWLKQYIDFNTQKRMNAKNSFEKDFFKLMNNSVFGKTIENIREGGDVRLVTDQNKLSKLVSKATFVNSKILNEDLIAVRRIKETLRLNRPAYVGMCILDLSRCMISTIIILKKSMAVEPSYCLLIQTVCVMKWRLETLTRIFGLTKTSLK